MRNRVSWIIGSLSGVFIIGSVMMLKSYTPLPQATSADSFQAIRVGGTGILHETSPGSQKFRVDAVMTPSVELGTVDTNTEILEFIGQSHFGITKGPRIEELIGRRVTIMALVDSKVDAEEVFRPIRSRTIIVMTRQGVVNQ